MYIKLLNSTFTQLKTHIAERISSNDTLPKVNYTLNKLVSINATTVEDVEPQYSNTTTVDAQASNDGRNIIVFGVLAGITIGLTVLIGTIIRNTYLCIKELSSQPPIISGDNFEEFKKLMDAKSASNEQHYKYSTGDDNVYNNPIMKEPKEYQYLHTGSCNLEHEINISKVGDISLVYCDIQ